MVRGDDSFAHAVFVKIRKRLIHIGILVDVFFCNCQGVGRQFLPQSLADYLQLYRIDELARYRTVVPSDRSILELAAGWTSSLKLGKEFRQILYFVEKRMSVAEI